jgi:DNA polymerase-3 subunit alpha
MNQYYSFECGCKFPIIDCDDKKHPKIYFSGKLDDLNLNCSKTWDLISEGNTKGVFQLESRLGSSMAKKLKPQNIEQLSALISIMRPGSLEAIRDDKSVSDHYIDKKNGQESIDYFHPALQPILKSTYGEMIYQEQAMQIAQIIAGFDLQEADMLRKAIGKKKPEEMAKVKIKFKEGAKKQNIINDQESEEIFGWIEKSQRYSFNASHAVSYSMNAYSSAYAKAHFPKPFFASYLKFAKDKMDPQKEIKELIRNATEMDVTVCVPDLRKLNKHFIITDNKIYFGLTDIKGVGFSVYDKIVKLCEDLDIDNISWNTSLVKLLTKINSTAAKALISSGALDYYNISRTKMLFDYDIISELTSRELELIELDSYSLKECLENLLIKNKINIKRKNSIQNLINLYNNPPYSLIDKIEWLSDTENSLLGASITCFKIDSYDISMTNCDCKTFKNTNSTKNIILAGEISYINFVKTKKGKHAGSDMAFLTVEDQFASLDSVIVFPEQLSIYRNYLFEGNVLIFVGNKSPKKDSFVVEKCFVPRS